MGFFDYVTDLYSSLSVQPAYADVQEDQKYASGDFNDSQDQTSGGKGTAQQSRGATPQGGASTNTPAGVDQESGDEAEANKADAKKDSGEVDSGAQGHRPGDGGEKSGQVGADNAGPHGGSVGEDDDEEEEEEEEEEPEDPKPILEEGESYT